MSGHGPDADDRCIVLRYHPWLRQRGPIIWSAKHAVAWTFDALDIAARYAVDSKLAAAVSMLLSRLESSLPG